MLVKDWMSKDVITIDADDSMMDAINLLKQHNIRMLPVTHKGKLVGIVTDRDLRSASASNATTLEIHELLYLTSRIKVREIMTENPMTVPVDYTVEETAEVLLDNKISGVPVLDHDGKIVGTITQTDVFKMMLSVTALTGKGHAQGLQFAFQLEDRSGTIKEIADIIRSFGGRLGSILSSYENVPEGYRKVYIRAFGLDREKLPE
ncbi:MAG: CBS domain-containing protein, partial [Deltaproteobacteria bacterium]|nr:CBS domain-containing protein [Deltaproteobacteria bacterium]